MSFIKWVPAVFFALACAGCTVTDDLFPTGKDERGIGDAGTVGPGVGQSAPGFSTLTSLSDSITLSSELAQPGTRAVVLYFAMWCPVCNSHMDHLVRGVIPLFPDVRFLAVDYLSGSVGDVRANVVANGYAAAPLSVLADLDNAITAAYKGTMGTTVVIDGAGIVRMNEDYKNGARLRQMLEGLP